MPDALRASLRLELSDAEIRCPKKGGAVIALGRCMEYWREEPEACSAKACPIATRRLDGPTPAPQAIRLADAFPEKPREKKPPPAHLLVDAVCAHCAKRFKRRSDRVKPGRLNFCDSTCLVRWNRDLQRERNTQRRLAASSSRLSRHPHPNPRRLLRPVQETTMPKRTQPTMRARIVELLDAEPSHAYSIDIIADRLKVTSRPSLEQTLKVLFKQGKIARAKPGYYQSIHDAPSTPAPKAKKPAPIVEVPRERVQFEVEVDGDAASLIAAECDALREMLIAKNVAYGNSALDPLRVFSRANPVEQLRVRIDDKLSRLSRGSGEETEDVEQDLLGYLVLLRVARQRAA